MKLEDFSPKMVCPSGQGRGLDTSRVKEGTTAWGPDRLGRRSKRDLLSTDAADVSLARRPRRRYVLHLLHGPVTGAVRFELE
jgi:hypothetical protein